MNLALEISRRYLFSKKTTNVINIITGIAAVGISIGTAALLLVLCVFNGFEELVIGLMGNFNPDVKITPTLGKTFVIDSVQLAKIRGLEGVVAASVSLEEIAFFQYAGTQDFGIIKGVDGNYQNVTQLDSAIKEGHYALQRGEAFYAVVGAGIRNKLAINIDNPLEPLSVFMAKREAVGPLEQQFRSDKMMPIGTFSIQQDFDNQYVISSLPMVQQLLAQPNQASAIEVKMKKSTDKKTLQMIRDILGEKFVAKDKFQQNEAFLKIMNIEKWMSFVILCLTLVLVAFNLVGALWMIAMDKKKDISILKSMGMEDTQVRNTFLSIGFWLIGFGVIGGFLLAILLYFLHQSFGLVPIPEGFLVDKYPAQIRAFDFIVVGITVLLIGILAAIPAALKAMSIPAMVRED
jgi:lipoprotein-releasing system permease protein